MKAVQASPNTVAASLNAAAKGAEQSIAGSAHMCILIARSILDSTSNVWTAETVTDWIRKLGPYAKGSDEEQPLAPGDIKARGISVSTKGARADFCLLGQMDTRMKELNESIKTLAKDNSAKGINAYGSVLAERDKLTAKCNALLAMSTRAVHAASELCRAHGTIGGYDSNHRVDVTRLHVSPDGRVLMPLHGDDAPVKEHDWLPIPVARLISLSKLSDTDRQHWLDSHRISTGKAHTPSERGARQTVSKVEKNRRAARKVNRDVAAVLVAEGGAGIDAYAHGLRTVLAGFTGSIAKVDADSAYDVRDDLRACANEIHRILQAAELDLSTGDGSTVHHTTHDDAPNGIDETDPAERDDADADKVDAA